MMNLNNQYIDYNNNGKIDNNAEERANILNNTKRLI